MFLTQPFSLSSQGGLTTASYSFSSALPRSTGLHETQSKSTAQISVACPWSEKDTLSVALTSR